MNDELYKPENPEIPKSRNFKYHTFASSWVKKNYNVLLK